MTRDYVQQELAKAKEHLGHLLAHEISKDEYMRESLITAYQAVRDIETKYEIYKEDEEEWEELYR